MYRTAPILKNSSESQFTIHNAERVGENLVIHRTIGKTEDGDLAAIGNTWTVTLFPNGAALVSGIATRYLAREIAKNLSTAVAAFRAAVELERALLVDADRPTF